MSKKILAAVFTDNMVLQRNKPIKFFGKSTPGDMVTVNFNSFTANAHTKSDGSWELTFPPMKETEELTLTAWDGQSKVTLRNIALGEVWLAGGQSNMEFDLARCTDWDRVSKKPNPSIRFFYTPKLPYRNDAYYEAFDKAVWQLSDNEEFGTWSAVAYLFAEKLQEKLGVTIGIIGCNWGGTSASAWMSREAILENADTRIYIDEFDERNAGKSLEQQQKEYDDYLIFEKEWNEKCNKCYSDNPSISWDEVQEICGQCQWPGPINNFNPFRPAGLYDQMLMEICPYSLRGFIYYQGESDDHRPRSYYKLFSRMISLWRENWGDDTLPFIITQLPMHKYLTDPDFKNWPIIREAQMRAFRTIKNTGITVIPDCGQWNEIHPVNKGPVGERMALQALWLAYGLINPKKAFGPIFKYKVINGSSLEIHFDYADGLHITGEPKAYEIAGEDKVFYRADIDIVKDVMILTSPEVPRPVYARYCWSNYVIPSLFGGNNLPAAPFRTDFDDEISKELGVASIQQNMET